MLTGFLGLPGALPLAIALSACQINLVFGIPLYMMYSLNMNKVRLMNAHYLL